MAKSKTEIHVTTVFDGELDATDVFVSLIAQKYSQKDVYKRQRSLWTAPIIFPNAQNEK